MNTVEKIHASLIHKALERYTAVLIARDAAGEAYVLGSKVINTQELQGLERSGAVAIQRHFKCPRLLYVILN